MEDNPRLLWGYVEVALRPRRSAEDATWLDALNRIYREIRRALGLPPGAALTRGACGIANEHWPTELLARARRAPTSAEAAPQAIPMIAVRLSDGGCILIDGADRAERIASAGAPGRHSVVVILAPEQEASDA